MKKAIVLLVLAAMILTPVLAFAASPWTEKETYNERISGKFQLGLKNTLLGWTDLFIEPIRAGRGCGDCANVWAGMGKGLVDAILNTVGGAAQLITFPLVADIPIPEDGVQFSVSCDGCMDPAAK